MSASEGDVKVPHGKQFSNTLGVESQELIFVRGAEASTEGGPRGGPTGGPLGKPKRAS